MKQFIIVLTILTFFTVFTSVQAQNNDMSTGYETISVPENIQSILHQIKMAEVNEDWTLYSQLRESLIQTWQQVNPEVAKLYRNVNNGAQI